MSVFLRGHKTGIPSPQTLKVLPEDTLTYPPPPSSVRYLKENKALPAPPFLIRYPFAVGYREPPQCQGGPLPLLFSTGVFFLFSFYLVKVRSPLGRALFLRSPLIEPRKKVTRKGRGFILPISLAFYYLFGFFQHPYTLLNQIYAVYPLYLPFPLDRSPQWSKVTIPYKGFSFPPPALPPPVIYFSPPLLTYPVGRLSIRTSPENHTQY